MDTSRSASDQVPLQTDLLNFIFTEQVSLAGTRIREVLGSNLDQDTVCPGWGFVSLQANAANVLRLGHDRFLLSPIQSINRFTIWRYIVWILKACKLPQK
jgi:hypothetical protein